LGSQTPDPNRPSVDDRFVVGALIGEGSTAAVYRASDQLTGRCVAIKVVHRNLALHRRFRHRFVNEIGVGCRLCHPAIVPVYFAGQTDDERPYAVLGYASDGNLADILTQGIDAQTCFRLFDQVLAALSMVHAHALVHQDLKPQNVLIWRDDTGALNAWLTDLGEVQAQDELSIAGRVRGTPAYMAPEQRGKVVHEMGPPTDLYPVGLMLHEALSGQSLGGAVTPTAETCFGSAPLLEVVRALLHEDPRQRYDFAADAKRALARAVAKLPKKVLQAELRCAMRPDDLAMPVVVKTEWPQEDLDWNQVQPDPLPEQPLLPSPDGVSWSPSLLRFVPLRFTGRGAALQIVWDEARDVIESGEPRIVLIRGHAGTGKSRLVQELTRALLTGAYMETIRLDYNWPPGAEDGYRGAVRRLLAPWQSKRSEVEARLGRWLARDRDLPVADVAREASILARWCGFLEPDEAPVNAAMGLSFLHRHLATRSWRGGTCLVLENVERARLAGDGFDIAESVMDHSIGTRPILVLATVSAESVESDADTRRRFERLRNRGATVIDLAPLEEAETVRMLERHFPLTPYLTHAIARKSEGLPLFVSLVLQYWATQNYLEMGPDLKYGLRAGLALGEVLPSDLESLIALHVRACLDQTEDRVAATEALSATALSGSRPPIAVIRGVNESGLDALLSIGLLKAEGAALCFEHEAVERTARRVAHSLMLVREVHERLATSWAALGARTGMDVSLPAGVHLLRGNNPQAASTELIAATGQLLAEGRSSHALVAADLAIEAADRFGSPMARQDARRLAAEAALDERDFEGAEQHLRIALTLEPLDRLTLSRLRLLLSRCALGRGDVDSCRRELDQAEKLFQTLRDREGLRDVAHGRAVLERVEGRPGAAAIYFQEAIGKLRKDPRRHVIYLAGLAEAYLILGKLDAAEPPCTELMHVAAYSGDTRNIAQGAYCMGLLKFYQSEYDTAERLFRRALALASTFGELRLRLNCENTLGEVARAAGQPAEAKERYHRMAALAESTDQFVLGALGRLNLALMATLAHDTPEAHTQAERAERNLDHNPRHWLWSVLALVRAVLSARRGDESESRSWWAVAREHGLEQLRAPDFRTLLLEFATNAARHGWDDLTQKARALGESAQPATKSDAG